MTQSEGGAAPRLIKKYPNRRLYDTQTSAYITLADVKLLVLANEDFKVVDAKCGDDLTRSILLQIILEEEGGGVPMFSSTMLAQIIRFYGHAMQGFMGSYLEKNIQAFMDIQDRMAEQSKGLYGSSSGQFGPEAKHDEQLYRAEQKSVCANAGSGAGPGPQHVFDVSVTFQFAGKSTQIAKSISRTPCKTRRAADRARMLCQTPSL